MITNLRNPVKIAVGVAVVIGVGGVVIAGGGPNTGTSGGGGGGGGGGPQTANVWMVTSGGTCSARQSTPVTLASAPNSAKCTTLNSACGLASAGDTVRIQESTTYPAQTLNSSCGGSSGNRVTIDAENGSTGCNRVMITFVSVTSYTHNPCPVNFTDEVKIQGSHDLTLKNMSTDDWFNIDPVFNSTNARITADNWHTETFQIGGTDLIMQNGETGGLWECNAANTASGYVTQDIGRIGFGGSGTGDGILRVTVDNYLFHDLYDLKNGNPECDVPAPDGPHSDCLQINQGDTITIKNSQFWNCATSDIQSNSDFGPPYANLTYENNFFGHVYTAGNGAEMGSTSDSACTGTFTQRYNTYAADAGTQVCGGGSATFLFEGNLLLQGASSTSGWDTAGASSTIRYNVFSSGSLGTNATTCTASITGTNTQKDGLHLSPSDTCAKDAGNPSSFPATDIDGGTRPASPDVGADEIGVP